MMSPRKLFCVGALLILAVELILAQSYLPHRRKSFQTASTSCTTARVLITGSSGATPQAIGSIVGVDWIAFKFTNFIVLTNTDSGVRCSATLRCSTNGTPTFTAKVHIFADASPGPGTETGTPTDAVSVTTLTGSEGDFTLSNGSWTLSDNVVYWLAVETIGAPNNSSDYLRWYELSSGSSQTVRGSTNGVNWSDANTFAPNPKFTLFGP